MTDRPIIFSGQMVRAIFQDRKTQTRRILKPQLVCTSHADWPDNPNPKPTIDDRGVYCGICAAGLELSHRSKSGVRAIPVRYAPGDRLWVRETCGTGGYFPYPWAYRADGKEYAGERWTPPIHMPRRASRLTLIVEAVKVERLQAISREDAIAEGCESPLVGSETPAPGPGVYLADERTSFAMLWNRINGPGAWDANPWVVTVTFRTVKNNIDRIAT